MKKSSWLLWAAIVLLSVLPLCLISAPPGAEGLFGGSDDRARQAIGSIAPHYQPWFAPVFEPASGEIASLLFALEAAVGAGVIGYWLGLSVARERAHKGAHEVKPSAQDQRAD